MAREKRINIESIFLVVRRINKNGMQVIPGFSGFPVNN